jgi:hypothetical protein
VSCAASLSSGPSVLAGGGGEGFASSIEGSEGSAARMCRRLFLESGSSIRGGGATDEVVFASMLSLVVQRCAE